MVIETRTEAGSGLMGSLARKTLLQAKIEKRLVVGVTQIGRFLAQDQSETPIICFVAPPKSGDHALHMLEVLLQAYCLENDIYIVHLDSAEKMSRVLNSPTIVTCALVCANPSSDSDCEGSFLDQDYEMTKSEKKIVDFCEDHWNESQHSTIRLPAK
jgi:growth arrest and DNA-damage-inducible protein